MQPKVAARTVAHKTNLCHIGMYKPELTWPGPASLKNLNLPQKIIIHLDSTMLMRSHWHLTLRSVLNNKFSVLTFLRSVTCLMSIEQSICTKKMVQLQSMSNVIISIKALHQVYWCTLSDLYNILQVEQSNNENLACIKFRSSCWVLTFF